MGSFDTNTSARPRIGAIQGELPRGNVKLPSIHELTSNSSHGHSLISPRIPHGNIHSGSNKDSLHKYKYLVNPPGYYAGCENRGPVGPSPIDPHINSTNKIMPALGTAYHDKPPLTQYQYYPSPHTFTYPPITHLPHQTVYYPQYAPHVPTIAGSNHFVAPEVINKTNNVCQRCGTTETPEWRRGPGGVKTLCNACGLFHAKLVKRKGAAYAAEEVLNNKVCKGKNGRRISIKKNSINNDRLKDEIFTSITGPNSNTKSNASNVELSTSATPRISAALIHH